MVPRSGRSRCQSRSRLAALRTDNLFLFGGQEAVKPDELQDDPVLGALLGHRIHEGGLPVPHSTSPPNLLKLSSPPASFPAQDLVRPCCLLRMSRGRTVQ